MKTNRPKARINQGKVNAYVVLAGTNAEDAIVPSPDCEPESFPSAPPRLCGKKTGLPAEDKGAENNVLALLCPADISGGLKSTGYETEYHDQSSRFSSFRKSDKEEKRFSTAPGRAA